MNWDTGELWVVRSATNADSETIGGAREVWSARQSNADRATAGVCGSERGRVGRKTRDKAGVQMDWHPR